MGTVLPYTAAVSEGDDARIDAAALRSAREERDLSVSEAARQLTLSRAQVEQIEQGGVSAFYSPAHKALAVRKYAASFGLDADAVLGIAPATAGSEADAEPSSPACEASDANAVVPEPPHAGAAGAAAEEGDGNSRRPLPFLRDALAFVDVRASAHSLVLGLLLFSAMAIAFAIARGGIDRFAAPPLTVPAAAADEPSALTDQPAEAGSVVKADALQAVSPLDACAISPAPGGVPEWMPPYVRKPGTRLYIGGPPGSEVCVSDGAGKVSRLVLKSGAMQAIDGLPPYLVQSPSLDALQMFMQGLKVKIPAQSAAMRLLPGEGPAADAQITETLPAS